MKKVVLILAVMLFLTVSCKLAEQVNNEQSIKESVNTMTADNIYNLIGQKCKEFNDIRTFCEGNSVVGVYCDRADGVTEKVNVMLEEARQMSNKCFNDAEVEFSNAPAYVCGYGFNSYENFETKPRTKDDAGFIETYEYLFDNQGCLDFVSSKSLPNIDSECCRILSNKANCLNEAEIHKKQAYDYGRQNYAWQSIQPQACPPMTKCESSGEYTASCKAFVK